MSKFLSVAIVVLSTALSLADGPKAVIVGRRTAEPGNSVVLTSDGSVGTDRRWTLTAPTQPAFDVLYTTDGKVMFASAKPVIITFVLSVADSGKVDVVTHTVTIGSDVDPVPPGPVPPGPVPPGPVPPVPASEFGLTKLANDAAKNLTKADRHTLAANVVTALKETTIEATLNKLVSLNKASLQSTPTWAACDAWGAAIGERLQTLNETERRLKVLDDWRRALKEVANGLEPNIITKSAD